MRLIQFESGGARGAGIVGEDGLARVLRETKTVRDLALRAIDENKPIMQLAQSLASGEADYEGMLARGEVLPPVDHPDPARLMVSGTGLTHYGSANTRDKMHADGADSGKPQTDSMRMFQIGVKGGKPEEGKTGAQPEWFYKGNGGIVARPGGDLLTPSFAEDGGEEPEIAGIYIIDGKGMPRRIGFALGNEFSDHIMEKRNYLYLAHSKLRPCSIGPELLTGELPRDIQGESAIIRGGKKVWQQPFASGEKNMCHSIANLERHHFKYGLFCRPGDVHVHFFGTATLSFADGFRAEDGDVFEIQCPAFGRALRNTLRAAPAAADGAAPSML